MKHFIITLVLLISSILYAQKDSTAQLKFNDVKIKGMDVSMTFNHQEELVDLDINDLEEVFEKAGEGESITFELKYEDPKSIVNGKAKRSFSYKVEGKTSNLEKFINNIRHIKKSALKVLSEK